MRTFKLLSFIAGIMLLFSAMPSGVFADEGVATWYGPGFQGKRMSNGQTYDMNDPTTTAANRWPMGTWLKVTNQANGKSVTVQVRDRGGFNHAFDLSYAAFAILDDPRKMQIKVTYEVVPGPDTQPTPVVAPAPVPTQAPSTSPPPAAPAATPAKNVLIAANDYTVKAGDTLASIAAAAGVPLAVLVTLNGIDNPDSIAPGQHLKLRETARPAETSRSSPIDEAPRVALVGSEYIIKPGDTLGAIANVVGMDADALAALNGITDSNMIQVGQHLRTTQASANSNSGSAQSAGKKIYSVVAGDTLSGIALKFSISEDAILKLNAITNPDEIAIGRELQIPSSDSSSGASQLSASPKQYAVKQGETLSDIAIMFNADADAIARYNGIADPKLLQSGQTLTIP